MGFQSGIAQWDFKVGLHNGISQWDCTMGFDSGISQWDCTMGFQPNQYSGSNINEKIIEACFLLFEKRVSNIALLPVKKLRDYMVTDASFEEEKFLTLISG